MHAEADEWQNTDDFGRSGTDKLSSISKWKTCCIDENSTRA